jgi:acyl-coenzyme A thioesterase PaaI-like protein
VKHGRQLAMIEVSIVDDKGRLCAKGRILYAFRAGS